jgi:maltose O-acetyltransferase
VHGSARLYQQEGMLGLSVVSRPRDPLGDEVHPHSAPGGDDDRARHDGHEARATKGLGAVAAGLARAWFEETNFDPRKVAAQVASRVLPQFSFPRTRTFALRAAGLRIGARSGILGPIDFTGAGDIRENFSIGEDTFISGPLHVDLGAPVRIGSRVRFGHHIVLLTIDHELGPSSYRCGRMVVAPITIGDGVWVASRVTILPGVSVGDGAVLAAGAIVTRDVAPDTMVAGVPAKLVRTLAADAPERKPESIKQPPPEPDRRSS